MTATFVVELVAPLLILADVRRWRLAVFGAGVAALVLAGGGHLGLEAVPWLAGLAALLDERLWRRLRPASAGPPRAARVPAAIAIAGLMVAISATGSYGFFQLLTLALCVPLLDDAALRWSMPPGGARRPSPWLPVGFAIVVLPLSALQLTGLAGRATLHAAVVAVEAGEATLAQRGLAWLAEARGAAREAVGAFASVNGYGLFATMTRDRVEIIVEGSADGVSDWRPYRFRYKPGDPGEVGAMAGLHMPRLDWQLWFAALRPQCQRGWYPAFIQALLRGSKAVRGLLADDPFPGRPPRAIRSRRVRYTFTDRAEQRASGRFWSTADAGMFCPTMTRPVPGDP
ncbi:MAG: lipase maturation factor family protein [bacterium]